jgi:F0F1-type ATP synthase alpha subunit
VLSTSAPIFGLSARDLFFLGGSHREILEEEEIPLESFGELGFALTAQDNIVRLLGLDHSFMGELVEFHSAEEGLTLNLALDDSSIAVLGREDTIIQGEAADRTYEEVLIPVGFGVLGTVLSPLGHAYIIY